MDERITSILKSSINHFELARVTRMREVMKRHVDSDAVPGLVMLVHHRGREHADAIGIAPRKTFSCGALAVIDTVSHRDATGRARADN